MTTSKAEELMENGRFAASRGNKEIQRDEPSQRGEAEAEPAPRIAADPELHQVWLQNYLKRARNQSCTSRRRRDFPPRST